MTEFSLYKKEEFLKEPVGTKFRIETLQGSTYYHNIAVIKEKEESFCWITLLDKKPPQGIKLYYHEIDTNEKRLIYKFTSRVSRYQFVEQHV